MVYLVSIFWISAAAMSLRDIRTYARISTAVLLMLIVLFKPITNLDDSYLYDSVLHSLENGVIVKSYDVKKLIGKGGDLLAWNVFNFAHSLGIKPHVFNAILTIIVIARARAETVILFLISPFFFNLEFNAVRQGLYINLLLIFPVNKISFFLGFLIHFVSSILQTTFMIYERYFSNKMGLWLTILALLLSIIIGFRFVAKLSNILPPIYFHENSFPFTFLLFIIFALFFINYKSLSILSLALIGIAVPFGFITNRILIVYHSMHLGSVGRINQKYLMVWLGVNLVFLFFSNGLRNILCG